MENQDKIYEQFKAAAKKSEQKEFPAMDKVWERVEQKLDTKKDRKVIFLWKKIAIAASLLLLFSLGYHLFSPDNTLVPKADMKEKVVVNETVQDSNTTNNPTFNSESLNPNIKSEAATLLDKQISNQNDIVSNESDSGNNTSEISDQEDFEGAADNQLDKKSEVPGVSNSASVSNSQIVAASKPVKEYTSDVDSKKDAVAPTEASSAPVVTITVKGIVSDETGPIPGANVVIKGTKIGTQTDIDGKYSIVAEKGDELVFSYIGMNETVATVGPEKTISPKLKSGAALGEVVVTTALGIRRNKKELAYATQQVNGRELVQQAQQKAVVALAGRVAGLNITKSSKPDVIVRGYKTLSNGNAALVVVNGVVMPNAFVDKLDPANISTVNVLKSRAATALYGSAAQNGAIIITTKKGYSKRRLKSIKARINSSATETPIPAPDTEEDYESFIENPFESPATAPLSTFSIDVDNASYTNVRRFINSGQKVPKDAVRVEEMINFFKYQYPQPTNADPFSINSEYGDCPWNPKHKLLRIGLQGKNIATAQLPASNLVFLIDVSGSMAEQNKLPLLCQSLKVLINELRKEDKVAIVVYAGAAGLVLPPTTGDQKQTIIDALDMLQAGGSTAGGAGIELAYKLAQENFIKGGNNRVILATDGDFNVGSSANSDMQTLIEEKRKSGVFLTCLGYGMGNYKDSKMEILSDKGNGNYAYIDNIQEANRFLGKEFKGSMYAIAKDVKIQIEFNPKHVQSYRLIGYENRKLQNEDFTNDAIDAGELGSGHTVTALYEIIPQGIESTYFKQLPELKYSKAQQNNTDFNDELATIKFRYKKPDGSKSIEIVKVIANQSVAKENASADFHFSSAVAWFGLKLRESQLIENKSTEEIIILAKAGLLNDTEGYRAEFIRLVEAVK